MTRRRLLRIIVGVTLALVLVVVVTVWRRASGPPAWWSTSLPGDPTPRAANAPGAQLENAVTTAITQPRAADQNWDLVITEQQASSWLTGRLPLWLANRSVAAPDNWSRTAVAFRAGEIQIAAEITTPAGPPRYIGLVLRPSIDPDADALNLRAIAATLGRQHAPFAAIAGHLAPELQRLADASPDPTQSQALRRFIDSHAITLTPSGLTLDDGRLLRITDIQVQPGRLLLRCRTTRPPPATPPQNPRAPSTRIPSN